MPSEPNSASRKRRSDYGSRHQQFSSGQKNFLKGIYALYENAIPPKVVIGHLALMLTVKDKYVRNYYRALEKQQQPQQE